MSKLLIFFQNSLMVITIKFQQYHQNLTQGRIQVLALTVTVQLDFMCYSI